MPFIQVTFPMRPRRIKQAIKKDLFWYDTENQKMFHANCTELRFKSKLDMNLSPPRIRFLPEPIIREGYVTVNKIDQQDIIDWWDDYQSGDTEANLVMGSISEIDAMFDVPDEEMNDFLESLEDDDFIYEVL